MGVDEIAPALHECEELVPGAPEVADAPPIGVASIHVLVFRCARAGCRALWRVAVLATSGNATLVQRAATLGSDALRRELLAAFGGPSTLPMLAALDHRLVTGVRIM